MRLLIIAALFAAASARNAEGTSFCPDSYAELEWPNAKPGIVCRCVPAADSDREYSECTSYENSRDCEDAFGDTPANRCVWSVYDWSGDSLADSKPVNEDGGEGWVNEDGTVTDCNGQSFSAEDCKYRNKSDCMAYLGDGICDFGQRFTAAGVRTGPNFACDKFSNDKGDCECPDTMTCDGYCLDDNACAKEAYNFSTCSDWFNDNVCDYGQRTSDFGVSINFDCHITDDIAAVPDLMHRHDHGFCDEWDWHTRYDKQTLLDNFAAECPEPQPTNSPTVDPTNPPSKDPTKDPTNPPVNVCMNDPDCWCPTKLGVGDRAACCEMYPEYTDCVETCWPLDECAGGGHCFDDCNQFDKDADGCKQCGADHCKYNKKLSKGSRCYRREDDPAGCSQSRDDEGNWKGKKSCQKIDKCTWAPEAGLKVKDIDGDSVPDVGEGMCIFLEHPCNAGTTSKACGLMGKKKGLVCQWNGGTSKCDPWDNATCYDFKKKKACIGVKKVLGCRYGKKGGKDKPKGQQLDGGIDFNKVKCYHWSDLCGVEGQVSAEDCPVCPDGEAACSASKDVNYKKSKKVKFKSCKKLKNEDDCMSFQKKKDCYWWSGDGESKHEGGGDEGCYEATLGDDRR